MMKTIVALLAISAALVEARPSNGTEVQGRASRDSNEYVIHARGYEKNYETYKTSKGRRRQKQRTTTPKYEEQGPTAYEAYFNHPYVGNVGQIFNQKDINDYYLKGDDDYGKLVKGVQAGQYQQEEEEYKSHDGYDKKDISDNFKPVSSTAWGNKGHVKNTYSYSSQEWTEETPKTTSKGKRRKPGKSRGKTQSYVSYSDESEPVPDPMKDFEPTKNRGKMPSLQDDIAPSAAPQKEFVPSLPLNDFYGKYNEDPKPSSTPAKDYNYGTTYSDHTRPSVSPMTDYDPMVPMKNYGKPYSDQIGPSPSPVRDFEPSQPLKSFENTFPYDGYSDNVRPSTSPVKNFGNTSPYENYNDNVRPSTSPLKNFGNPSPYENYNDNISPSSSPLKNFGNTSPYENYNDNIRPSTSPNDYESSLKSYINPPSYADYNEGSRPIKQYEASQPPKNYGKYSEGAASALKDYEASVYLKNNYNLGAKPFSDEPTRYSLPTSYDAPTDYVAEFDHKGNPASSYPSFAGSHHQAKDIIKSFYDYNQRLEPSFAESNQGYATAYSYNPMESFKRLNKERQRFTMQGNEAVIVPVPQPYPVKVPIAKPVAVPIIKEIKVPVEKVVPYPVFKNVPYPVEKHIPVPVEKRVPVLVDKPYPVRIPVVKTIYHHADGDDTDHMHDDDHEDGHHSHRGHSHSHSHGKKPQKKKRPHRQTRPSHRNRSRGHRY